jgi:hypothetical protein
LRGPVVPHGAVHGGRDHDAVFEGEGEGGEKVVGDAVSDLRDGVGGGGAHEQELSPFGKLDVRHVVAGGAVFAVHGVAGHDAQRLLAHEVPGALGEHDRGENAVFGKEPYKLRHFIGGDAARYAEDDALNGFHRKFTRETE